MIKANKQLPGDPKSPFLSEKKSKIYRSNDWEMENIPLKIFSVILKKQGTNCLLMGTISHISAPSKGG